MTSSTGTSAMLIWTTDRHISTDNGRDILFQRTGWRWIFQKNPFWCVEHLCQAVAPAKYLSEILGVWGWSDGISAHRGGRQKRRHVEDLFKVIRKCCFKEPEFFLKRHRKSRIQRQKTFQLLEIGNNGTSPLKAGVTGGRTGRNKCCEGDREWLLFVNSTGSSAFKLWYV